MSGTEIERLLVRIEANAVHFENQMKKVNRALYGSQAQTRKTLDRIKRDFRRETGEIASIAGRVGVALGAMFSVQQVTQMADAYTALQNRLKVVGLEGRALVAVQDHLFESATRNGVEIGALGDLYGRLALSTADLGVGQADLLRFVDGVTASLRVQGTSTQAASGALLQLGQALGSGTVRAEEINSILEATPVIAQAAATGMNTSVAQLRKSITEGKVSSQQFFDALMRGFPAVEAQAEESALTIGQALTGLRNELIKYIGQTDDAVSASERIAGAIQALAENLDRILPIMTAVAGFFGIRYVAGLAAAAVATSRATVAAQGLRAATLALAGGPLGLTLAAVSALTVGLIALAHANTDAAIAARAQASVEQRVAPAKSEFERLILRLASAQGELADETRRATQELINQQRVELVRLRRRYTDARQDERQQVDIRQDVSNNATFSYGGMPAGGFQFGITGGRDRDGEYIESGNLRRLRAEYEAQAELVREWESALEDATSSTARPPQAPTGGADRNAAKRAEQRRRMIGDMERETATQEASLGLQVARVRELEREAEMVARVRQLEDAGFSAAEAARRSGEIQARLDDAREQSRIRQLDIANREHEVTVAQIDEDHEIIRAKERQAELEALIATFAEVTTSEAEALAAATSAQAELDAARARAARRALTDMREEHRIRVAELTGNRELLKALQDQAEIRERTRQYRESGAFSTADEAERQATAEVTRERQAANYGEQRDLFASAFSDGIRAALSGDLQGFLSNQFGTFAEEAFERLGERLYDQIFGQFDAVSEGAAQGAAQGAAAAAAITSSGNAAATAMGAAITLAGREAAKAMATAITAGSAGGKADVPGLVMGLMKYLPGRAAGGPVNAGQAYLVGEKRPEVFVPRTNGTIIPSVGRAARTLGRGRASGVNVYMPAIQIDATGADAAALARVESQVQALRRDMPSIAVGAVANARDRRIIA